MLKLEINFMGYSEIFFMVKQLISGATMGAAWPVKSILEKTTYPFEAKLLITTWLAD